MRERWHTKAVPAAVAVTLIVVGLVQALAVGTASTFLSNWLKGPAVWLVIGITTLVISVGTSLAQRVHAARTRSAALAALEVMPMTEYTTTMDLGRDRCTVNWEPIYRIKHGGGVPLEIENIGIAFPSYPHPEGAVTIEFEAKRFVPMIDFRSDGVSRPWPLVVRPNDDVLVKLSAELRLTCGGVPLGYETEYDFLYGFGRHLGCWVDDEKRLRLCVMNLSTTITTDAGAITRDLEYFPLLPGGTIMVPNEDDTPHGFIDIDEAIGVAPDEPSSGSTL